VKLGIVPVAGAGKRWGGYPKFLLPCGEKEWFLDRAARQMPCDRVVIVAGSETLSFITEHIHRSRLHNVTVVTQKNDWDIYGAIHEALQFEADYYYLSMPDTYLNPKVFKKMDGFSLGAFWTDKPERFGIIRNNKVFDKQPGLPGWAWGCVGFHAPVRDLWLSKGEMNFPTAINSAIEKFGLNMIEMPFYYDMAEWKDYVQFIRETA